MAAANGAISFVKRIERALDMLDADALEAAQARHDAVATLDLARRALFGEN